MLQNMPQVFIREYLQVRVTTTTAVTLEQGYNFGVQVDLRLVKLLLEIDIAQSY